MKITEQDRINEAILTLCRSEDNINVVIEVLNYIGRPNLAQELTNVNNSLYRVINMLDKKEIDVLPENNT